MADLKPCPFCGGDAEMDTRQGYAQFPPNGKGGSRVVVYCRDCSADIGVCREDVPSIEPEQVAEMWNRRTPAPRAVAFDGADLRESNLAMMIRRLCSMRIDGTFAITEKKRDEALELLRSMGLQGSPLRDTHGVTEVPKNG